MIVYEFNQKQSFLKKGFFTLLFTGLILGLFSCSGDSEEVPVEDYFVKGKISGQEVLFSVSSTSVLEDRLFIGFAGNNPNSEYSSFSFSIESVPISLKEFKETDPGIDMVFRYSLSGTEIYNSQSNTNTDFVISFSSFSNNIAQGTFRGTLTRQNDSNQSVLITEGSFRLPID